MTSAPPAVAAPPRVPALRLPALAAAVVVAIASLSLVHLGQGTAAVGLGELIDLVLGRGDEEAAAVVIDSRLPRLLAGVVVGLALGAGGAALQSVARNPLASPDTLAVNAGAHLAIVAAAAAGVALPAAPTWLLAFLGGLAAAGLVLALSSGGSGDVRLVLAGSAIALALAALTSVLLLLFAQETTGLFAWGSGSLAQIGMQTVQQIAPAVLLIIAALLLLGRRLDMLGLGDDAAAALGLTPRRTRAVAVVLSVLLSAGAVTVAGPIGFVGLCAPALMRLLVSRVPGLHRHRVLVPLSAGTGVVIVLGADVLLRGLFGAQAGVEVPTGVVTTILGAVFLVVLAQRSRDTVTTAASAAIIRLRSRRAVVVTLAIASITLIAALVAGALLGDAKLLLGDLANWLSGQAGPTTSVILGTRMPRVFAALLAGAALAIAGTVVQSVSKNPLAEPGIIGVVGGAGLGAVAAITLVGAPSAWLVGAAALTGASLAALLVFGLSARGGLEHQRLVLIGVAVSAGSLAVTSMLIVLTDPYNETKALTWLSGSTYGRGLADLLPVAAALALALPLLVHGRRTLDLLSLDDDTPRLLGVRLGPARLRLLALAVALTATAVAAVGAVGFVGLVAPHAARALVGRRHALVLPTAALLGATLVSVADTIGRTAIAPAQLPAGLMTALVGAPYFVWLLWRGRALR